MSKRAWKTTQETVSVVSGIGTLLLGFATIWLTIQVSGVEDYLRSEIRYRNDQLVAATDNLKGLDRQKDFLQRTIASQSHRLSEIHDQVAAANARLAEATRLSRLANANLDTRLRAQAYGQMEDAGSIEVLRLMVAQNTREEEFSFGENFLKALDRASDDPDLGYLKPYIVLGKTRMATICPEVLHSIVHLPSDTIARDQVIIDGQKSFSRSLSPCLCSALANEQNRALICKPQRIL